MSSHPRIAPATAIAAAALLLCAQAPVMAITTQSATMCRVAGTFTDPYAFDGLVRSSWGVRNSSPSSFLQILCPIVRASEIPAGGTLKVWVDGNASRGATTCTLYSMSYSGVLLGSSSMTGTGVFDGYLSLPYSQVPMFSSQVVYCALPPSGTLFDIEPVT